MPVANTFFEVSAKIETLTTVGKLPSYLIIPAAKIKRIAISNFSDIVDILEGRITVDSGKLI